MKERWMQVVQSGWKPFWVLGLLNRLLQWMLSIIIFNPATDNWMAIAPQGFSSGVLGSCGLHAYWKENIVHICQCLWESWDKEDTQILFSLLFFFSFLFLNGEEKYLFSNLDSSLSLVCINMLFVIKSLFFFFLFVHPVSQANANTPNNALNVPHVWERKDKN